MGAIESQISSLTIVYSTVYSDADQRKHQSSASLAFVRGIHRRPVNSPHKWQVTRKMCPFDDVIMALYSCRGWLWTHPQIAHQTSADRYSSGACVPTWRGSGDAQNSVWWIVLDILSNVQLLINIVGQCGQRNSVHFFWSTPPWSWKLSENDCASRYGSGCDVLLIWSSLIWSSSIDTLGKTTLANTA